MVTIYNSLFLWSSNSRKIWGTAESNSRVGLVMSFSISWQWLKNMHTILDKIRFTYSYMYFEVKYPAKKHGNQIVHLKDVIGHELDTYRWGYPLAVLMPRVAEMVSSKGLLPVLQVLRKSSIEMSQTTAPPNFLVKIYSLLTLTITASSYAVQVPPSDLCETAIGPCNLSVLLTALKVLKMRTFSQIS